MTEQEALDAVAEQAAMEIYKSKPYQRTSGLTLVYDQDKGKLPLREWFKRHWQRFPNTFPHAAVAAKKATHA